MSRNLSVLFIYRYLTVGGVETVLRTRLQLLSQDGIHPYVWFLHYVDGKNILHPDDPKVFIGGVGLLEKHLSSHHYDIISSIDTDEVFPVMMKNLHRSKLVIEPHTPYRENLEYLRDLGEIDLAAILVPSAYQAKVVQRYLREERNIVIVPNPLADEFERPLRDFDPTSPLPIIAWIGRIDHLKNWKEWFRILEILTRDGLSIRAWLIGRVPRPEIVRDVFREAKKRKVLKYLRWYKNLPFSQMATVLDAVRSSGGVVVSTSRGESFGMTIAEAMARGCPVVVPDHEPFNQYVINEVNGLLYRLGHPGEGAQNVERFLTNKQLRETCGGMARESILRHHAPDAAIAALADVLGKIRLAK